MDERGPDSGDGSGCGRVQRHGSMSPASSAAAPKRRRSRRCSRGGSAASPRTSGSPAAGSASRISPARSPTRRSSSAWPTAPSAALVAVCEGGAVGVDVEQRRPIGDLDRIAALYLAPVDVRAVMPARGERKLTEFFGRWTAKEAYTKALGTGLVEAVRELRPAFPGGRRGVVHSRRLRLDALAVRALAGVHGVGRRLRVPASHCAAPPGGRWRLASLTSATADPAAPAPIWVPAPECGLVIPADGVHRALRAGDGPRDRHQRRAVPAVRGGRGAVLGGLRRMVGDARRGRPPAGDCGRGRRACPVLPRTSPELRGEPARVRGPRGSRPDCGHLDRG